MHYDYIQKSHQKSFTLKKSNNVFHKLFKWVARCDDIPIISHAAIPLNIFFGSIKFFAKGNSCSLGAYYFPREKLFKIYGVRGDKALSDYANLSRLIKMELHLEKEAKKLGVKKIITWTTPFPPKIAEKLGFKRDYLLGFGFKYYKNLD